MKENQDQAGALEFTSPQTPNRAWAHQVDTVAAHQPQLA
jgi:hypothetical protein